MFGFAAPTQRRLDGLDQWGAQSQAQTQQQLAATDAQLGQAQPQQQPAPQAAPAGAATPGATPAPAPTPLQNAASQVHQWLANRFGPGGSSGGGAAAPAADPYAAVNVQPGQSGQHPVHAYLASLFGG